MLKSWKKCEGQKDYSVTTGKAMNIYEHMHSMHSTFFLTNFYMIKKLRECNAIMKVMNIHEQTVDRNLKTDSN